MTLASHNILGGNSKHLAVLDLGCTWLVAKGLGLPGASSHWNGTEAKVWIGGVNIPAGDSCGLLGRESNESLGVGVGSEPMVLNICFP